MEKQQRMSPAQLQLMIDTLRVNPELISGRITEDFTLEDRRNKWQSLADLLNSITLGAKKNAEKWRRSWIDYRRVVCVKAIRIKHRLKGEPGLIEYLTPTEKQVLKMIRSALSANDPDYDNLAIDEDNIPASIQNDVKLAKKQEGNKIKPDKLNVSLSSSKRRKLSDKNIPGMETSFSAIHKQMELQVKSLNEQTRILQNIAKSLQLIAEAVQHQ